MVASGKTDNTDEDMTRCFTFISRLQNLAWDINVPFLNTATF